MFYIVVLQLYAFCVCMYIGYFAAFFPRHSSVKSMFHLSIQRWQLDWSYCWLLYIFPSSLTRWLGLHLIFIYVMVFFKVGRKASLICGSAVNVILAITVAILDRVFCSTDHQVVSFIVVSLICIYAFSTSCTWLWVSVTSISWLV